MIKMWFALHYNNILTCVTCVTMATNLLHLMTMTIIFYMENGFARLQIDIHNSVFVNFLHSFLTFL
jgi:hypothetical protein